MALPISSKTGPFATDVRCILVAFISVLAFSAGAVETKDQPAPEIEKLPPKVVHITETPPAPPVPKKNTGPVEKKVTKPVVKPAPVVVAPPPPVPVSPPAPVEPPPPPVPEDPLKNLKESFEKNPKDRNALMKLAEAHFDRKEWDEVTKLIWSHVDRAGRAGLLMLTSAHEKKEEWGDVIRAANLILSKEPENDKALSFLGRALFFRKKNDEAKEALKKALEINRKNIGAYETLALIYEKNPYEKRLLYQDMIETFGPKAELLTKLCALNTQDGENEQGETYCDQAINADPTIPENYVNLAVIARQKGEEEKALKLFKNAAEKFKNSDFAQTEFALHLENKKNYIDAFKHYDLCLTANPDSEKCLVGVGNTGVQIQKFEASYEAFRTACRKYGRKHSLTLRKASYVVKSRKNPEWLAKFESLTDQCVNQ